MLGIERFPLATMTPKEIRMKKQECLSPCPKLCSPLNITPCFILPWVKKSLMGAYAHRIYKISKNLKILIPTIEPFLNGALGRSFSVKDLKYSLTANVLMAKRRRQ